MRKLPDELWIEIVSYLIDNLEDTIHSQLVCPPTIVERTLHDRTIVKLREYDDLQWGRHFGEHIRRVCVEGAGGVLENLRHFTADIAELDIVGIPAANYTLYTMPSLKKLTMSNIMQSRGFGTLHMEPQPNLKVFHVVSFGDSLGSFKAIMYYARVKFPKLEHLSLCNMNYMHLPNLATLRTLTIEQGCGTLGPQTQSYLTYFEVKNGCETSLAHLNFPRLETLVIDNCPNLSILHAFPSLQTMTIVNPSNWQILQTHASKDMIWSNNNNTLAGYRKQ
jgi:hypothetical protein